MAFGPQGRTRMLRSLASVSCKTLVQRALSGPDQLPLAVQRRTMSPMDPRRRPRVLVADDHPRVLKSLQRLLSFDCDVVGTVDDGCALLDSVARLQPDVVVADLNLPCVDGLDACRQLTRSSSRVKVILLSAMDDVAIAQEALASGASAFLVKYSLRSGELVAVVKRACSE